MKKTRGSNEIQINRQVSYNKWVINETREYAINALLNATLLINKMHTFCFVCVCLL